MINEIVAMILAGLAVEGLKLLARQVTLRRKQQ